MDLNPSQNASPAKSSKGAAILSPSKAVSGFENNLNESIAQYQSLAVKFPNERTSYTSVVEALKKELNKFKYEKNRLVHAT